MIEEYRSCLPGEPESARVAIDENTEQLGRLVESPQKKKKALKPEATEKERHW